jgi:hypothetical protein
MTLREADCEHCGGVSGRPVNPGGSWWCFLCGKFQRTRCSSCPKDGWAQPFPQLAFEG